MSQNIRCARETGYNMGQPFCDTVFFPVHAPKKGRRSLGKPTPPAQEEVNKRNAIMHFTRVANANFVEGRDVKVDLTFDEGHCPATRRECKRAVDNFLRRLKRAWKNRGFEQELRYLYVIEGADGKRLHVHLLMSGGLTVSKLRELWGMCEILNVRVLQAGQKGFERLSKYLTKQGKLADGEHRWYGSRNLVKPDYAERNAHIPMAEVEELGEYIQKVMSVGVGDIPTAERYAPIEKHYPGYFCAAAEAKYLEQFRDWVIHVKLFRKDTPAGQAEQDRRRNEERAIERKKELLAEFERRV